MRITWGATRFVVLAGPYAIKIAKVPIIRPLLRLARGIRDRDLKERLENHDPRFLMAVVKYFGSGVLANRIEFRISEERDDPHLAKTHRMLLWGLVNIQERGEAATDRDVAAHPYAPTLSVGKLASEVLRAQQFCIVRGRTVLADYGHPHIAPELARCR